jgi:hypothetical protein
MTTVSTRVRQITVREGFAITVTSSSTGRKVGPKKHGVLAKYPFMRRASDRWKVSKWIARFEETYPGYTCRVESANGNRISGNALLEAVRATY